MIGGRPVIESRKPAADRRSAHLSHVDEASRLVECGKPRFVHWRERSLLT